MKAVTLVKAGNVEQAFEVREHPMPTMKPHQVLIKVEAFGLNFADVMARKGLYREAPPMPSIIGYDVVGVVEQAGEEADQNLVGKRVTALTRFGGYAEYVATNARAVAEVPADMPAGTATALATQYTTAYHSACEKMNLFPGDHVLVHAAAGGVGTALVQLAKWRGCIVYGTASKPEKLEYLKSIGVDHAINYRTTDYEAEARKLLGEKGRFDAIFNAVGGKSFKKDMRLLGSGGSICCFGAAERSSGKWGIFSTLNLVFSMGFIHPIFMMMRSKTVVGINMLKVADYQPEAILRSMKEVVKLTEAGVLKPHVGGEFSVNEVGKAHAFLEGRDSIGKVVVKW